MIIRFLCSVAILLFITACGGSDDAITPDTTDDTTGGTDDSTDDGATDDTSGSTSMVDFDVATLYDDPLISSTRFVQVNSGETATVPSNWTIEYGLPYEQLAGFEYPNFIFYRDYIEQPITYFDVETQAVETISTYFDNDGGENRFRKVRASTEFIAVVYYKQSEFDIDNGNPFYVSVFDPDSGESQTMQIIDNTSNIFSTSITDKYLAVEYRFGADDVRFVVINLETMNIITDQVVISPATAEQQRFTISDGKVFIVSYGPNTLKWVDLDTGVESEILAVDDFVGGPSNNFKAWASGNKFFYGRVLAQPGPFLTAPAYVDLTTGETTVFDITSFFATTATYLDVVNTFTEYTIDPITETIVFGTRRGNSSNLGGLMFTNFSEDFVQAVSTTMVSESIFILH